MAIDDALAADKDHHNRAEGSNRTKCRNKLASNFREGHVVIEQERGRGLEVFDAIFFEVVGLDDGDAG